MSALGHFRTKCAAANKHLFDHRVGAGKQRLRHGQAEPFRGLEIDHQLVFGRRLNRKIGRLFALEDAIDIGGRASVLVDPIGPIGYQAALGDDEVKAIDRGELVPGRKRNDQIAMNRVPKRSVPRSGRYSRAGKGRDGTLDLAGLAHI